MSGKGLLLKLSLIQIMILVMKFISASNMVLKGNPVVMNLWENSTVFTVHNSAWADMKQRGLSSVHCR